MYTSLYALGGDVNSLFEYMRILATQELNPTIIPPHVLKTILHRIENDIKSNARLKLCENYPDCTFNRPNPAYEPIQST